MGKILFQSKDTMNNNQIFFKRTLLWDINVIKNINVTFREWKQWIADKIKRNILTEGDPLCPDAWTKIKNICRKTVQDLTAILKELGEFKNKVLPVDQNKRKNQIEMYGNV